MCFTAVHESDILVIVICTQLLKTNAIVVRFIALLRPFKPIKNFLPPSNRKIECTNVSDPQNYKITSCGDDIIFFFSFFSKYFTFVCLASDLTLSVTRTCSLALGTIITLLYNFNDLFVVSSLVLGRTD